jgi:hypothetical protein
MKIQYKSDNKNKIEFQGYFASAPALAGATRLVSSAISSPETSLFKVQICGKIIKRKVYQFPLHLKHYSSRKGVSRYNKYYRLIASKNAYDTIELLLLGNFSPMDKFITLTFRDTDKFDIRSLSDCNKRKSKFIKKFQKLVPGVRYLGIPEIQMKNGRMAIHYHLICNAPYIHWKLLQKLWPHGTVDIAAIQDKKKLLIKDMYKGFKGFGEVIAYMAKYMSKNIEFEQFKNHRRYFCSNNLEKPMTIYGDEAERIINDLYYKNIPLLEEMQYITEFYGIVTQGIYRVNGFDTY